MFYVCVGGFALAIRCPASVRIRPDAPIVRSRWLAYLSVETTAPPVLRPEKFQTPSLPRPRSAGQMVQICQESRDSLPTWHHPQRQLPDSAPPPPSTSEPRIRWCEACGCTDVAARTRSLIGRCDRSACSRRLEACKWSSAVMPL